MAKQTLDHNHHSTGSNSVEPDNLPVKSIAWAVAALVVIVVGVYFAVNQLYWASSTHLVQKVELDVPNKLLTSLQAADKLELTTYGEIDKEKGVYRVPIDVAIELYVKKNGN